MNENTQEIENLDKEREDKLFVKMLAANSHISESQHILLHAWVRLMLRIEEMPASREMLRFTQEARLLGASLKLMPTKKQDKTMDLAAILADEHTEV